MEQGQSVITKALAVTWIFNEDKKRSDSFSCHGNHPAFYVLWILPALLHMLRFPGWGSYLSLLVVTIFTWRIGRGDVKKWHYRRKYKLTGLRVRFMPDEIIEEELYGNTEEWRSITISRITPRYRVLEIDEFVGYKSGPWWSKEAHLHSDMFVSPEAIDLLMAWAKNHEIEVPTLQVSNANTSQNPAISS